MNQRDQKLKNRSLVLSLLRSQPGISQVEIAACANLQPSTTSNLIRRLKQLGLVQTVGKRESGPQGGKKADLLALRPDYGYFGGIYVKEDEITFSVVDFSGRIVERRRVAVADERTEEILGEIVDEIVSCSHRYPTFHGTGIAVSSIVDLAGEIEESTHFGWSMPRILSEIHRRVPKHPVVVDNDANCAADWDLARDGQRYQNLIHLQVQTSPITIGAGIVIAGEVYRGIRGAAGELLQPDISERSDDLVARIEETVRFVATFMDSEAVYVAGELDAATVKRLSGWAEELGATMPQSVHILDNPDIPVLGASLQAVKVHMNGIIGE